MVKPLTVGLRVHGGRRGRQPDRNSGVDDRQCLLDYVYLIGPPLSDEGQQMHDARAI